MSKKQDGLISYPYPTYWESNYKDEAIPRLNKEFEKIIKKDDIKGNCPPDKIYRLRKAYESHSIASLYYWLENSPVDFNTGSDIAVILLHYKYKNVHAYLSNEFTHWHESDLSNFIYIELPDLSGNKLNDIGFKDKKELVKAILDSFEQLKKNEKTIREKYSYGLDIISPFLTYEYWLACYRENNFDLTFNEEKEKGKLEEIYNKWFDYIVLKIIQKRAYPQQDLWHIYDYYYDDKLYHNYKVGDLNTNLNIIEVYSGNSGYKIAYRIINLKTIYSGDKGTKVAYRIDDHKIYIGEAGTKVAYRIEENTIYSGETGTKVAFRIDGKNIYSGESGNKVVYRLER